MLCYLFLFSFNNFCRIGCGGSFNLLEDGEKDDSAGDNKDQEEQPCRQSRVVGIRFQPSFSQQVTDREGKSISQRDQQEIFPEEQL